MKFLIFVSLNAGLLVTIICAQNAEPDPTASPISEDALSSKPAPSDLLLLPAQPADAPNPYDLMPEGVELEIPGLRLNKLSAEQQEKDKVRFRQLRTIAMRNLYALYLYDRAKLTKTEESRREYLRAYYESMCNQMRQMEPRLKAIIDVYENLMISRVIQYNVKPTIPVRDLAKFRAEERVRARH